MLEIAQQGATETIAQQVAVETRQIMDTWTREIRNELLAEMRQMMERLLEDRGYRRRSPRGRGDREGGSGCARVRGELCALPPSGTARHAFLA